MKFRHDETGSYLIDDKGNAVGSIYEMAVVEKLEAMFRREDEGFFVRREGAISTIAKAILEVGERNDLFCHQ